MASTSSQTNSLGLEFGADEEDPASQTDQANEQSKAEDTTAATATPTPQDVKKKPYVNTERVKTGGPQRDKLSEEELTERMRKMREQNEAIKQRRIDVKADEDAFKETQKHEQAKLAKSRKVQENVDRSRTENAKRKMDKIQSREWDSGKPAPGDNWKNKKPANTSVSTPPIRIAGTASNQPSTAASGGPARGPKADRGKRQADAPPKAVSVEQAAIPSPLDTTTSTTVETS